MKTNVISVPQRFVVLGLNDNRPICIGDSLRNPLQTESFDPDSYVVVKNALLSSVDGVARLTLTCINGDDAEDEKPPMFNLDIYNPTLIHIPY